MYTLYFGNKNYSSWSLRAWVLMKAFGIPFEEQRIHALRARFSRADPRPFAFGQGAVSARRQHDRLGLAFDRRVSGRAASRHVARRRRRSRLGALGDRRDAFRLQRAAQRIRDEPARPAKAKTLAGGRQRHRADCRAVARGARALRAERRFPVVRSASSTRSTARSPIVSTAWRRAGAAAGRTIRRCSDCRRCANGPKAPRARPSIFRCSTARWRRRSSNDSAGRRMSDLSPPGAIACPRRRRRHAAAHRRRRSMDFYGQPDRRDLRRLGARRHRRLRSDRAGDHRALRYPAVSTSSSGMAQSGQMLAFEPPHFGPKATIAASIAAAGRTAPTVCRRGARSGAGHTPARRTRRRARFRRTGDEKCRRIRCLAADCRIAGDAGRHPRGVARVPRCRARRRRGPSSCPPTKRCADSTPGVRRRCPCRRAAGTRDGSACACPAPTAPWRPPRGDWAASRSTTP